MSRLSNFKTDPLFYASPVEAAPTLVPSKTDMSALESALFTSQRSEFQLRWLGEQRRAPKNATVKA